MKFLSSKPKPEHTTQFSIVEKWEAAKVVAQNGLAEAEGQLGEVLLAHPDHETTEAKTAIADVHDKIAVLQRKIRDCDLAIETAKIQNARQEAKAKAERELYCWAQIDKKLRPEITVLAKEIEDQLNAACTNFWKILKLTNEVFKTAPHTDGTILGDSPLGDPHILSYFRRQLRKNEMRWAYPHFEQRTDNLPTFTEGLADAFNWIQKMDPNQRSKK